MYFKRNTDGGLEGNFCDFSAKKKEDNLTLFG